MAKKKAAKKKATAAKKVTRKKSAKTPTKKKTAKKKLAKKSAVNKKAVKKKSGVKKKATVKKKAAKKAAARPKTATKRKSTKAIRGFRRFELVDGKSSKFWEIKQVGSQYTVRYGRIGTDGQSKLKDMGTNRNAAAEVEKLIKTKLNKGYSKTNSLPGVAELQADSCSLSAAEHDRVRKILQKKTPEAIKRAIDELNASKATNEDFDAVFATAMIAATFRVSPKQMFTKDRIEKWEAFFTAVEAAPRVLTRFIDAGAEALSRHKGSLYLYDVAEISDAASQSLSRYKGELSLGVRELSNAAAEALAEHEGELSLANLTALSDSRGHLALTEALAKQRDDLWLNGLIKLSDAAAEVLAKHKGGLYLDGLIKLSDAAAGALATHKGSLSLTHLTALSDSRGHLALAEALAKQRDDLWLNGLIKLSDAAAEVLAKHKGGLYLDGLVKLSDAAAGALATHKGSLSLERLNKLSDSAVKAFAKHKGDLSLGITTLSDTAAKSLATHKGNLSLWRINKLSAVAADALDAHEGDYSMYHADQKVKIIAVKQERKKQASRSREKKRDTEERIKAAELINNAMAGDDGLLREQISRWRPVTLSALSEIAKLEKKSLRLLTTLTLAEYRSLDPYEQQDVLERCFSEYEKSLHALLGILTKKVGQDEDGKYDEHFDTYRIGLDLPRIKTLSGEAAELLRYYPGSSISLTSLKKISDEAVAALAKYRGHIDLQGVNNLSETALLALANHKDRFHYNGLALGLSRLDDSSAEILAGFKGHAIFLNKLTKISDSAADSLSRYKGDLYLEGLRQLSPAAAQCLASHRGNLTLGSRCKLSDEAAVAISFHSNLCR